MEKASIHVIVGTPIYGEKDQILLPKWGAAILEEM